MEPTKSAESTKDTSKTAVSIYNFEEIELPQAIETTYEQWVQYGEGNQFPQDLIIAWLQSPIHNALTNGIVQMIAGGGVKFSAPLEEVEAWRLKINRRGDTLDELINRTSFDLYLHGYFGWQIVWNQQRTKIVEVYHTPAEQIRSGKVDEETLQIQDYFVSWDWTRHRKKGFKPVRVPVFDLRDRSEGRQMMFVKQYRPSQYYYSTPSYIGGLNWVLMDNRIGEFHLNNIENGFFPSSIVQFFNGEPPQEEKRSLELNFMQKFTGKNQAKIVFVYNNNQDQRVAFDTYEPANIDRRFRDIMPEVAKNIMIAHRVPSPLLFGIRDAGGLGNNAEELQSSSLLLNKMVIVPFQQIIINQLAEIFKINNWPVDISIETLQPDQWLDGDPGDAEADTGEDKPGIKPETDQPEEPAATIDGEPPTDDVAKTALNGAQISSLMEIVGGVTSGLMSKDSAKAIMSVSFPTFSEQEINDIIDPIVTSSGPPPAVEQKAAFSYQGRHVIDKKLIDPILAHLKEKGQKRADLEADGWVLIQDDQKLTKEGIKLKIKGVPEQFQSVAAGDVQSSPEDSSALDTGLYKIRYEYRGPRDEKNRDFCGVVLDLGLIYRREDIGIMSAKEANPEFGRYSIWEYKGSYGCRHRWHRLVFFRKRNNKGQFLPSDGLENDKLVGPAETPGAVIPEDTTATTKNPKPGT